MDRSIYNVKGKFDSVEKIYKKYPIEEVRESLDMDPVEEYIIKRKTNLQNTISQEDYDRTLLNTCMDYQCGRKLV